MGAMNATSEDNAEENPTEKSSTENKSKEEPAEDPDLADLPKSASQKTKTDWKAAKEARRQLERERDSLKAELETLKKQPSSPQNQEDIAAIKAELEQYKSQISDYETKIAAFDVEQTKEYRENIKIPMEQKNAEVMNFVKKFDLDMQELANITMMDSIVERNSRLAEMADAAGMDNMNRMDLKVLLDDLRGLYYRSQKAKATAQESLKYLEKKRQEEAQANAAKQQELRSKASQQVWDSITKGLPEVLRSDEATLKTLAQDALSSDILSAPPEIQAYATQAAVLLPTLKDKIEALAKENAELKASIAKRSGAQPKAKSGSIPTPAAEEEEPDFMSGLADILKQR